MRHTQHDLIFDLVYTVFQLSTQCCPQTRSLPVIAEVWMKHKKAEWYALKLNLFSIIFWWHGVLYHLGINLSHLVKNSIHPSMQAFIFRHRFFCTQLWGCWSISQLGWRQSAPWTGHQFTAAPDRETNNHSHSHSNLSPASELLICVHVFGVDARAIRENPCWYRYPQKGPQGQEIDSCDVSGGSAD